MRRWQALNVAKYSIIDLAPFLETKLYHYLQLVPEGDEENDDEWEAENSSLFSAKRFIKYGLSFTSYAHRPPPYFVGILCSRDRTRTRHRTHAHARRTALACLLYVPLDVLTTQMVVYPTQYSGVVDCARKVWAAEGLKVPTLSKPFLFFSFSQGWRGLTRVRVRHVSHNPGTLPRLLGQPVERTGAALHLMN